MAHFHYTAMNRAGESLAGELSASSRNEALRLLQSRGLLPVLVSDQTTQKQSGKKTDSATTPSAPPRLKTAQLILFTEELADMLEGGLQMDQALRVISQRQDSPALRRVADSLREQLREGSSVAKALEKASPSFDDLYRNLVAAGEVSGSLAPILRQLAQNLSVMADLQSKVTQAMIYPTFLIGACAVLMVVFMTVMVPQITDLLQKNGQQLPTATRALIAFNQFLGQWWWLILAAVTAAFLSFRGYTRSGPGKLWWHASKLRLPLIGPILAARFHAQFSHSLGSLIGHGVPLLGSIKLVARISANVFIQGLLARVNEQVSEGSRLSAALGKVGHFPAVMVDMIAVGEQTGRLSHAMQRAALRYDKELDVRIKRMTALISPVIIAFMAIIVGTVAYSIISAVFGAVNTMRSRV